MLVYRDGGRRVDCRRELESLRRLAGRAVSRDATLGVLIRIAEFESGVADALAPDCDRIDATSSALRAITECAADAWLDDSPNLRSHPTLFDRLADLETMPLPPTIELRVSEGYAYYGLHPSTYAAAAARFAGDTGAARVHVLGIRSIGTSLSAVVAAALRHAGCSVSTSSVRPRGHPFDRRLIVDASLADVFRHEASSGAWFAIVDEGPGLSGSSFAAVAAYLRSLGIPASHIVFFPSWDPDPVKLRSAAARRIWLEHRQYSAVADPAFTPEVLFGIDDETVDWSAGRWRDAHGIPELRHVPTHPQHERWKVFVPRTRRIVRFAGLGHYGDAIAARATVLAELGVADPPGELRSGFLDLPFVPGSSLSRCEGLEDAAAIGRYIGRIAAAFTTGQPADTITLARMIETNLSRLEPALRVDPPVDLPAVALDGRMLAHEWIRAPHALYKVDALDHHADHFLPGPQSPAWDLAGAGIELAMTGAQSRAMLDGFERESGDRMSVRVLPFYRLAYAAFRYGYATLASETLTGTEDGARFARAAMRYSQCALNAAACFTASAKSPRKQIARSSMKT